MDQPVCAPAAPRCPPPEPVMRRYAHPIHLSCPCARPPAEDQAMDRVLEELTRQNQLLLDLLGAVNALTAAALSIRSRFVGRE